VVRVRERSSFTFLPKLFDEGRKFFMMPRSGREFAKMAGAGRANLSDRQASNCPPLARMGRWLKKCPGQDLNLPKASK
jgi:hypothetical protein